MENERNEDEVLSLYPERRNQSGFYISKQINEKKGMAKDGNKFERNPRNRP